MLGFKTAVDDSFQDIVDELLEMDAKYLEQRVHEMPGESIYRRAANEIIKLRKVLSITRN